MRLTCRVLFLICGNIFRNVSFYNTSNLKIRRRKTSFLIHITSLLMCSLVSVLAVNTVLWLLGLRRFDTITCYRSLGKRLPTTLLHIAKEGKL